MRWSVSEISSAIVQYAAGPRAYRLLLRKGYPYPSISTLKVWLRKIQIQPGILKTVLKLVDFDGTSSLDKVCCILFDEMKIRKEYVYDAATDETLPPYSYVQVVMMTGVYKSWKQPIFFDYDRKMTARLLMQIIKFVEEAGFHVIAIISDLGGGNRGLHSELGISYNQPYFNNPCNNERIYVFADVPHLLKLIRNHFVDEGFVINNVEINKTIVESVLEATSKSDLRITHKMTVDKLNVIGAQRMRVKFAAKLFSHTISKTISRCGTLGHFPPDVHWPECADLFKLVRFFICSSFC